MSVHGVEKGLVGSAYQGPIPSPEMMKDYSSVDSTFPDRLLSMAEEDSKRDTVIVETERERVKKTLEMESRGQIFVFVVVMVLVLASCVFFYIGNNKAGISLLAFPALKEIKSIFAVVIGRK